MTSYETFNDFHPLQISLDDSNCQIHKNRISGLSKPTSFLRGLFNIASEIDGLSIKGLNLNMTSLQRITPAREQTLQTADDRGVYNDGKSNSFILIIKKKYLKYI